MPVIGSGAEQCINFLVVEYSSKVFDKLGFRHGGPTAEKGAARDAPVPGRGRLLVLSLLLTEVVGERRLRADRGPAAVRNEELDLHRVVVDAQHAGGAALARAYPPAKRVSVERKAAAAVPAPLRLALPSS
jgi:hypothetical protein